jgi:hypothetical protein
LHDVLNDLEARVNYPEGLGVAGRIVKRVLGKTGGKSALDVRSETFNQATECFYRETLMREHGREGFAALRGDLASTAWKTAARDPRFRPVLREVLGERDATEFVREAETAWLRNELSSRDVLGLIRLLTLVTEHHTRVAEQATTRL